MSDLAQCLKATFLSLLPAGGATKGNDVARHETEEQLPKDGLAITEEQHWQVHAKMVTSSATAAGKRRGESVRFADVQPDFFALTTQVVEVEEPVVALKSQPKAALAKPIADRVRPCEETQVISFCRREKRKSNPEVSMVTPATNPDAWEIKWKRGLHSAPKLQFDSLRSQVEFLLDKASC